VCPPPALQVVTFEGSDVWLRIMAAEKAGLIKVNLEFKRDKVGAGGGGCQKFWGGWGGGVLESNLEFQPGVQEG
jgi:hypothetical protein